MKPEINLDKLTDTYEMANFVPPGYIEAYLDLETGQTLLISTTGDEIDPVPDDIDSDRYIRLPSKADLDLGHQLAIDFAEQFLPGDTEQVRGFFRRKGAYARFKDLLDIRGLLQRWYDYEAEAERDALREWCELNEITVS